MKVEYKSIVRRSSAPEALEVQAPHGRAEVRRAIADGQKPPPASQLFK